ncbi:hypothetical protein ACJRO7_011069 [Eucalyptus globulus]|uniref:Uncharacterized protein n=1 Tax=Eucalyptus globulus TaxID=34317 RepID=A0ABD3LHK1_EUCGL
MLLVIFVYVILMQSCLVWLHSRDITPELDEAMQSCISWNLEKVPKHHMINMRAGMSYVIMKMYFEPSGVYHVLRVVNTLQRILDMKLPLLMRVICPLQAQIACRKTARAGGFICAS